MKALMLFFLLAGCSHHLEFSPLADLKLIQSIWDSKNPKDAYNKIPGLFKTKEDQNRIILGVSESNHLFSFTIFVEKSSMKISSIRMPLNEGKGLPASFIKSELGDIDWRAIEDSPQNHPIRMDVSEYSEKLGAGFAYDKLDKTKNVRMIYWGYDPKNLESIF
jgi:hypothetical protein